MAAQHRELATYQRRLAAIDTTGWPTPAQVDYHIVRAEMNGLDFDHRVLQAVGEQPGVLRHRLRRAERSAGARGSACARGAVELWSYTFPLSASDAARVDRRSPHDPRAPRAGASRTSTGNGRTCGRSAPASVRDQSATLADLETKVAERARPRCSPTCGARRRPPTASSTWLAAKIPSKTGLVGHRRRELRLVPEERPARAVHVAGRGATDGTRARARACIRSRSRSSAIATLPPLTPVASADEHTRRFSAAVTSTWRS